MLSVSNLAISYDGQPLFSPLSFEIPTGSTYAITGPSGAGKSSLLHAICGLIRLDTGLIRVNDTDVTRLPTSQRNIGLVSQTNDLFPTMTVAENISFGLKMKRVPQQQRSQRVAELLELVGLPQFAQRDVTSLSGGEARRIALARALAPSPAVLLLDEPLTGLDKELHFDLMTDLKTLFSSANATVLLVTHNLEEAEFLASSELKQLF